MLHASLLTTVGNCLHPYYRALAKAFSLETQFETGQGLEQMPGPFLHQPFVAAVAIVVVVVAAAAAAVAAADVVTVEVVAAASAVAVGVAFVVAAAVDWILEA